MRITSSVCGSQEIPAQPGWSRRQSAGVNSLKPERIMPALFTLAVQRAGSTYGVKEHISEFNLPADTSNSLVNMCLYWSMISRGR